MVSNCCRNSRSKSKIRKRENERERIWKKLIDLKQIHFYCSLLPTYQAFNISFSRRNATLKKGEATLLHSMSMRSKNCLILLSVALNQTWRIRWNYEILFPFNCPRVYFQFTSIFWNIITNDKNGISLLLISSLITIVDASVRMVDHVAFNTFGSAPVQ